MNIVGHLFHLSFEIHRAPTILQCTTRNIDIALVQLSISGRRELASASEAILKFVLRCLQVRSISDWIEVDRSA
jgi:hypothetical protein